MSLDKMRSGAKDESDQKDKKSSVPVVFATKSMVPAISNWLEANESIKSAQAKKADSERVLNRDAEMLRQKASSDAGKVVAAIKIAIKKGDEITPAIKYTQAAKFSNMEGDEYIETLKKTFKKNYSTFFEETESFTINPAQFTEEELRKMVKALGPDGVGRLVRKITVKPTANFVSAITLDSDVKETWESLQEKGLCILAKPSFQQA